MSATAPGFAIATNEIEVSDVDSTGPSSLATSFDDETGQRSVIRSINVDFDIPVSVDEGAFELRNATGDLIDVVFVTSDFGNGTRATLTFTGTSVDMTGSLEDGNYELRVIARHVRDFAGNVVDDGVDSTDNFFRLLGDTNGSGNVNILDLLSFRTAYNSIEGDEAFNQAVDFNDDGRVNLLDLLAFRTRYGTSV